MNWEHLIRKNGEKKKEERRRFGDNFFIPITTSLGETQQTFFLEQSMTDSITKPRRLTDREIFYFRQRQKNRIYQAIIRYFAQQAEARGLTKSDIAFTLGKNRSQITRWFAGPGNLEIDTISDLLLAMNAEMDQEIVGFHEVDGDTDSVIKVGSPNMETYTGTRALYSHIVELG